MSEIAARVGEVGGLPSPPYKYFPTKRALLLAVLSHGYDSLFGDHSRERATLAAPHHRPQRLIWRRPCAVRDDPRFCRLMFRKVQSERGRHGTHLQTLNRRHSQLLVDVVEAGQATGAFRADLPPPCGVR